jgi:hypothetical protein
LLVVEEEEVRPLRYGVLVVLVLVDIVLQAPKP